MHVQATVGQHVLNPKLIQPDEFIYMRELDSMELKVNHLNLYLKTAICEKFPEVNVESVNTAIDNIDLEIFVNGICEQNNSVRTLLAKNIVYQLTRYSNPIAFSSIYGLLGITSEAVVTK